MLVSGFIGVLILFTAVLSSSCTSEIVFKEMKDEITILAPVDGSVVDPEGEIVFQWGYASGTSHLVGSHALELSLDGGAYFEIEATFEDGILSYTLTSEQIQMYLMEPCETGVCYKEGLLEATFRGKNFFQYHKAQKKFSFYLFPLSAPESKSPVLDSYVCDENLYLGWTPTVNATSYTLELATTSDFTSDYQTITDIPTTPYHISPPLPNGTYYWRVQAHFAMGDEISETAWSATNYFHMHMIPDVVLTAPSHGTTTYGGQPEFSWEPVEGFDSYYFQLNPTSDFSMADYPFEVAVTSFDLQSIGDSLPNGTYYWRVSAKPSVFICQNWSDVFTFAVEDVPDPELIDPASCFESTPTNSSKPTYTWLCSIVPDSFSYELATDSSFAANTLLFNDTLIPEETATPESEYTFIPLSNFTDSGMYYFRVQAHKSGDESAWVTCAINYEKSDDIPTPLYPFSKPLPVDYCSACTSDKTLLLNDQTPRFEWTSVDSAATYDLEISSDPFFSQSATYYFTVNTGDTDFLLPDTDKLPDTANSEGWSPTYFWRVRAVTDEDLALEWSFTQDFYIRFYNKMSVYPRWLGKHPSDSIFSFFLNNPRSLSMYQHIIGGGYILFSQGQADAIYRSSGYTYNDIELASMGVWYDPDSDMLSGWSYDTNYAWCAVKYGLDDTGVTKLGGMSRFRDTQFFTVQRDGSKSLVQLNQPQNILNDTYGTKYHLKDTSGGELTEPSGVCAFLEKGASDSEGFVFITDMGAGVGKAYRYELNGATVGDPLNATLEYDVSTISEAGYSNPDASHGIAYHPGYNWVFVASYDSTNQDSRIEVFEADTGTHLGAIGQGLISSTSGNKAYGGLRLVNQYNYLLAVSNAGGPDQVLIFAVLKDDSDLPIDKVTLNISSDVAGYPTPWVVPSNRMYDIDWFALEAELVWVYSSMDVTVLNPNGTNPSVNNDVGVPGEAGIGRLYYE
jgi:hypothetical protein